ncbi:MAG: crossover junction endodeoxyribonuclease RuvC [Deltaproteobacteria bacterium]|nr:crossover junction endodeoxyribonuclease RuvC [Deltaproteobacteria bacterium]
MPQKNQRILAIDPGTRLMGVAFLDKGKLIYHGVKIIKKGRSPNDNLQYARRIILRLIKDFKPNLIVVENAFFARNRKAYLLNVLIDEIKAIARRKRIGLVSYSPSTVKKFITGNGWATKEQVAKVIVSKYPELKVYLTQDRGWKERFHQNMFDAVALGMMATQIRAT